MTQPLKCDVAIIGAGTAGLSAYRAVKKAGRSALLIEGGEHGTTCARVGCMPSKLLIAAAEAAHRARHAQGFGVHIDGALRIDGREVMERVRHERDRFVSFVLADEAAMPDSDKLQGHAHFISDQILRVDDRDIHAAATVIATGSSPVVPEIYRPLGDLAIVNDDVFYWQDLPHRVLVVGSGVIGIELGQALARLDVQVTIISRSDHLAQISDPAVLQAARRIFQSEFDLREKVEVLEVRREGNEAVVTFSVDGAPAQTGRYDCVLLTAGRRPNLDALQLRNTRAPLDERGVPQFDSATMRVGDTNLFIAGDVNTRAPILHEAADDGRIAGTNAAHLPEARAAVRSSPIGIVFSDPQVMRAGASFKSLDPGDTVIGAVDWGRQGRARVMLRNQGLLRVYADKSDLRLLGAEMVGPDAEHFAHLLAWCHQQSLTIPTMLDMPFYHPTLEEGLRTALRDVLASSRD